MKVNSKWSSEPRGDLKNIVCHEHGKRFEREESKLEVSSLKLHTLREESFEVAHTGRRY
jgi:hypothetical protein